MKRTIMQDIKIDKTMANKGDYLYSHGKVCKENNLVRHPSLNKREREIVVQYADRLPPMA